MTLSAMFRALTELHKLATLRDDWDGGGAPAPTTQAIAIAHKHLVALAEVGFVPGDIAADVLGGVALYYEAPPLRDGWSLWLGCMNSGAVTTVVADPTQVVSHGMVDMRRTAKAS